MAYFLIFTYSAITLYILGSNTKRAIEYLIFVCFFQNIALVAASGFLNTTQYTVLTLIKEIFVALLLTKLLVSKKIPTDVIFCLMAILILFGLMLGFGKGEMKGQLTSLRQLYLPFLFYAIGRMADLKDEDIKKISKFYVNLCVIAVVFGVVELFGGERLWVSIGVAKYLELKGVERYMLPNGMPTAFYTFELGLGYRVRRMASILVDPVILGQLLAFGFIIAAFSRNLYKVFTKKMLTVFILGAGLLFSMGKGGLVIAAVSFCMLLRDVSKKKIASNLLFAITFAVLIVYFGFALRNELSASVHYGGLISGLKTFGHNLLGTGIGSAGNFAQSYGSENLESVSASESYIGSMLAQTGIIGLFLNLIVFIYCVSKKNFRLGIDSEYAKISRVLTLSLFLTSFVNYTAISFTSCFIFFIYSGATKCSLVLNQRE